MTLIILILLSTAIAFDLQGYDLGGLRRFGFYDDFNGVDDLTNGAGFQNAISQVKNLKPSDLQYMRPIISNQLHDAGFIKERQMFNKAADSLPELVSNYDTDTVRQSLPVIRQNLQKPEVVSGLKSLQRQILP